MRRWLKASLFIALGAMAAYMAPAVADITYTVGSGTTIFDFVCFTTKHCPAHVNVTSAGAEVFTSGAPGFVQLNAGSASVGTVGLNAGTNIIGKAGIDQTTDGTTNAVHLVAGTAIAGKMGIDQTTDGTTNAVHLVAGTASIGSVNQAANVTATDCSSTITSGGTAQNAFSAQSTLHGFTIVNLDTNTDANGPLWVSFTGTAAANAAGSYPLQAATATTFASPGSFTTPPGFGLNHALSVIAANTGHKFSCTWW